MKWWVLIHSFDEVVGAHSFLWWNGGGFIHSFHHHYIGPISKLWKALGWYHISLYDISMNHLPDLSTMSMGWWVLESSPTPSVGTIRVHKCTTSWVKFSTNWPCLMPWRNSTHKPRPPLIPAFYRFKKPLTIPNLLKKCWEGHGICCG
jgi:hypothetical protein